MEKQTNFYDIYHDIATRTGGDIYIGVVGPVRTGKSTFIKHFMESVVLPSIPEGPTRTRALDALPQSADGRTVMTAEPKFVPDEAVEITLHGEDPGEGERRIRVRMIDCVGYMVPGANGGTEDGEPRLVHTPWSETPLPFEEAAEIGTRKVIEEHATIGVLVTTDGSVGDLPREAYEEAEARVVGELQAKKKPFVIVLNAKDPSDPGAIALGMHLEETYSAPVALVSCLDMNAEDVRHILSAVLDEFPAKEVAIRLPDWTASLSPRHPLSLSLRETLLSLAEQVEKTGEVDRIFARAEENPAVSEVRMLSLSPGAGSAVLEVYLDEGLFYRTVEEETGFRISDRGELLSLLKSLAETKKQYDRVADALDSAKETGYGIVMPDISELALEEPEIVRQNTAYGVRLRATAPSIHMIRANIVAEVSPIVGSEMQSEDMVRFLLKEFEEDPTGLWDTNLFGKSLYDLVGEGLNAKLAHMPPDARQKLSETLERIINEGSGGLICILL